MDKLSCLSAQTPYSNLGLVWWKCIFLLLPNFHFVIITSKTSYVKKHQVKPSKIQMIGLRRACERDCKCSTKCSWPVRWNLLVLFIAKYTLIFWTVFVEYNTGVFNLWAGTTECHWQCQPDRNEERNLGRSSICIEPLLLSH